MRLWVLLLGLFRVRPSGTDFKCQLCTPWGPFCPQLHLPRPCLQEKRERHDPEVCSGDLWMEGLVSILCL